MTSNTQGRPHVSLIGADGLTVDTDDPLVVGVVAGLLRTAVDLAAEGRRPVDLTDEMVDSVTKAADSVAKAVAAHEHRYSLVMPFVVVQSAGGPFDDEAFVAGCSFGLHHAEVVEGPDHWAAPVDPRMIRQYDLLAMDRGYTMTTEPQSDQWALVTFTPAKDVTA